MDQEINVYATLTDIAKFPSKKFVPLVFPPAMRERVCFPTASPHQQKVSQFKIFTHLMGEKWHFWCTFNLHLFHYKKVWAYFQMFKFHLYFLSYEIFVYFSCLFSTFLNCIVFITLWKFFMLRTSTCICFISWSMFWLCGYIYTYMKILFLL